MAGAGSIISGGNPEFPFKGKGQLGADLFVYTSSIKNIVVSHQVSYWLKSNVSEKSRLGEGDEISGSILSKEWSIVAADLGRSAKRIPRGWWTVRISDRAHTIVRNCLHER